MWKSQEPLPTHTFTSREDFSRFLALKYSPASCLWVCSKYIATYIGPTNPVSAAFSQICTNAIPSPRPAPVCRQKDYSERGPVACTSTVDSDSMCVIDNVADVTEQEYVELQLSPGISLACRTSRQEILPPCRCLSGLKPWVPEMTGLYPRLYPRPIVAAPAHIRPRSFPVWNIHVPCKG